MMKFIGKNEKAAFRLREAINHFENVEKLDYTYYQVIDIMKKIYKKCKLIHSDFSEYNLL